MNSTAKVVVIAIDAANGQLIEQWAAEGVLPNIQSLMATGLVGETRSVEGFFVGSTWPSFCTGTTPARHGFYSHSQVKSGTYDFLDWKSRGELTKNEPFWNYLSRAGRRVAILDVPLSSISKGLNGIQTVEWGAHDSIHGFQAWPEHLAATIQSRFGTHPLGPHCDADRRSLEDYRTLVDQLVRGARQKGELTRSLLAHDSWDFFIQVFSEAHCAGHQCWHLHDRRHPGHELDAEVRIGDPLREVYVAIDAAIGEVMRRVDDDALFVLLAAHGMGYWYGAQFLLREILYRLQVAFPTTPDRQKRLLPRPQDALAACWKRLPLSMRRSLKPIRNAVHDWFGSKQAVPTMHADPIFSKCFLADNGPAVGGIRLNLAGREPHGILQPGADADAFCKELARDLLEIVDERSGDPLIRRVYRTAELYRGEYLEELPDLLVEWSDKLPLGSLVAGQGLGATVRVSSPKIGSLEGTNDWNRTGEHRIEGMFVAKAPGIAPGRLERTISILDFAPTVTRLLGIDFNDYDGQPIPELLSLAAAVPVASRHPRP